MMQIVVYSLLVLVVITMGFFIWQMFVTKKQPLNKREFGYLRWVIPLINLFIFGLALGIVLALIFSIFTWLGGSEWLSHFSEDISINFSISTSTKTPIGMLIDIVNTIAILGILICMRAFMKNILTENIFVARNVHLARLSTFFFVLGSLVREGVDSSSIAFHGAYAKGSEMISYQYSFFSMNYLLTAVLVWTLSIILEKAIAIAEENEFTI